MIKTHKLNVLVIENNPLLSDGSRASDVVGMTDKVHPAVEELFDDIRYSSHGLVDCAVAAWETEDSFAAHKCVFKLRTGDGEYAKESNSLDEATFRWLFEKGWWGWWNNDEYKNSVCPENVGFSYDYAAMLEKHDVVRRRNRDEFNMIMLVNIDPVYNFEACMIGRNSYWINGDPIECDCPLTAVMNVSVSRRDANFECFGHMMENIMSHVFTGETGCVGYDEGEWNGIPTENMNLWQRFVLSSRSYDGISGCGNVHFSPNSVCDYDWKNETYVESNWRDWIENYPDFKGIHEPTNLRAYIPLGIGEKDACRLHHRWWFLCMPHVDGLTSDGYSNSWWDYFALLDYVTEIRRGDDGKYTLVYRSGAEKTVCAEDDEVLSIPDADGRTNIMRDGKKAK